MIRVICKDLGTHCGYTGAKCYPNIKEILPSSDNVTPVVELALSVLHVLYQGPAVEDVVSFLRASVCMSVYNSL